MRGKMLILMTDIQVETDAGRCLHLLLAIDDREELTLIAWRLIFCLGNIYLSQNILNLMFSH